ncbi:hypothetical protein OHA72_59975 [Dactylosporangium sp. NBC_01737]|nr:hypothetical protein OHA72_59975 [Dactylosporangium sp. NBC_01737]
MTFEMYREAARSSRRSAAVGAGPPGTPWARPSQPMFRIATGNG